MAFLERGILRAKGGKIEIGADVSISRGAANRLHIDDAVQISGTANVTGATQVGGVLTCGSALVLPHVTATPLVTTNGHLSMLQKANRSYLIYQCGGTPCYITLPQTTDGTIAITVGGTP